jgi:hypothetical protein
MYIYEAIKNKCPFKKILGGLNMSKKKKFKKTWGTEEIYEIISAKRGLNLKKKAIQFDCPHKDKKGNYALRHINNSSNKYLFKCKICKDHKIDLSILDTEHNGPVYDQIKAAFNKFKSAIDLAKLQSNSKDEKILEIFSSTLKKMDATKRILKKTLKQSNKKGKKKFQKVGLNVTSGGHSILY